MALTRAQSKRKAAGDPIYTAPLARRRRKNKRQRTNIDDLPDELLLLIVAEVGEQGDYVASLHALSVVKRQFNRLTVPSLYSFIDFDEYSQPAPSSFMRTLLESSHLAGLVRHLRWSANEQHVKLEDVRPIIKTIRALHLPPRVDDQLILGAYQGHRDTLLAVKLCLMPRLETFLVCTEDDIPLGAIPVYLEPLLHAARNMPFGKVHGFEHLSRVAIRYCTIQPAFVSALFKLPSLESLELYGSEAVLVEFTKACLAAPTTLATWECPPYVSSVKRLGLSGTLPSEVVSIMILSCSALHYLYFRGDIWLSMQPDWFRTVKTALEAHSQNLRRVSFDEMETAYLPPSMIDIAGQLGRFISFPVLDTYAGPLALPLLPSDVTSSFQLTALAQSLPPSIKHLLLEVTGNWDPHSLLDVHSSHAYKVFPRLERLYIRYMMLLLDSLPYALLDLVNYFANKSVEFSFVLDFSYARILSGKWLYSNLSCQTRSDQLT